MYWWFSGLFGNQKSRSATKGRINWEKKFANYVGSKFCISTNNGTDALILSLKSLDAPF